MTTIVIGDRLVQVPSFEFGPEVGDEVLSQSELARLLEQARAERMDRYEVLRQAFGGIADVHELTGRFSSGEVLGFLHGVLGSPSDFRSELSEMSDLEFAAKFDSPVVVELVQTYSTLGEGAAD